MRASEVLMLCLLTVLVASAYNPAISSELIYMSDIAFEDVNAIAAWNCTQCKKFNFSDVKAFVNTTLDIQGFVGYDGKRNAIIAAFRGSMDLKNWIADLDAPQATYPKCTGCKVHAGFYIGYQEVSPTVKSQVQLILNKYRNAEIYVTGHSLGAALSALAALDIKATFGKVDQLINFGQPRVGNQAFADYLARQLPSTFRVIHYADLVPHLPPLELLGYRHGGTQIWYTEDMQKYQVCTAEDPKCMDSIAAKDLSNADHDINVYMKLPASLFQLIGLRR